MQIQCLQCVVEWRCIEEYIISRGVHIFVVGAALESHNDCLTLCEEEIHIVCKLSECRWQAKNSTSTTDEDTSSSSFSRLNIEWGWILIAHLCKWKVNNCGLVILGLALIDNDMVEYIYIATPCGVCVSTIINIWSRFVDGLPFMVHWSLGVWRNRQTSMSHMGNA